MKKSIHRSALLLLLLATYSSISMAQSRDSSGERDLERVREEYKVQEKMAQMEKLRAQHEEQRLQQQEQFEKIRAEKSGSYFFSSLEGGMPFSVSNSGQSSQLSLSKSFDGESTKNEGTFEVDEKVSYINFSMSGSVREGRIRIIVTLPNGEKLKEMTIDNTADIQFNQMIRPRSEEKKYSGKWTYEVEAVKAVGNYRLSLQTK